MHSGKIHLLLMAGLFGSAGGTLFGGDFVPPAEGPVAFRRDQVPLDVDTMSMLSRQLLMLAQGFSRETDANRRTIAQMLALASALDPGNGKARELISDFKNGNPPNIADPSAFEKSRHKIWHAIAWLERSEAGGQGRALAACLSDIVSIVDPKNPRAEGLRAGGERGAWTGWVPQLDAYRAKVEVKPDPVEPPPPSPTDTQPTPASIRLSNARVSTVLWKNTGNDDSPKWIQVSAPLTMSAESIPEVDGVQSPFSLVIGPEFEGSSVQELAPTLLTLLKSQYPSLPEGQRVQIAGDALERSIQSGKRQSISAAAAVLASAAISGRRPDATIIGTVDDRGNFKLPSEFWNQLLALGPGNGERLVLPAAAANYLPSLLALGKPQFFLDYEVLLASNFKDLVEMSTKFPAEPLKSVSAQFREIREKMGTQPVGQYVANSFVRRRLSDISQAAPYHFSSKMLVIQGLGNRPAFIPRVVLSPEIRRAVEPLDWIVQRESPDFEKSELELLGSSSENCRKQLEGLLRYAEKSDQELITHAQELLPKVRIIERGIRVNGEFSPSYDAVLESLRDLSASQKRLVEELAVGEK